MASPAPIRVLIVDDSAVVRKLVTETLSADPDILVVGTAVDPIIARQRIDELSPDVITLDLEMPRMNGLTFLGILMRERPLPVIIMSSLTRQGSQQALEALRLGAVEVLAKPGGPYSFGDLGPRLRLAVKAAARARLRRPLPAPTAAHLVSSVSMTASACVASITALATTAEGSPPPRPTPPFAPANAGRSPSRPTPSASASAAQALAKSDAIWRGDPRAIILLGASTGGTEALREVLVRLPAGLPPIAIVQHIPAMFSKAFADRLNMLCPFHVREASNGETLAPGVALVAPGDYHLLLRWNGAGYRVELNSGPQVWHQRPAVDVLFKSAPDAILPHVIAGVLTGMGKDGAAGLLRLRQGGASTFAQDEATSIVYGMPREAWEQGGAQVRLPLDSIADHILRLCQPRPRHAHA